MKYLLDNVLWCLFVFLMLGFYTSRCDKKYENLCFRSANRCAGYLVGEVVYEVKSGYEDAFLDSEHPYAPNIKQAIKK